MKNNKKFKKSKLIVGTVLGSMVLGTTFGVVGYASTSSETFDLLSELNNMNASPEKLYSPENKDFFLDTVTFKEVEDLSLANEKKREKVSASIKEANASLFNRFGSNKSNIGLLKASFDENTTIYNDLKYKLEFHKDLSSMFNKEFILSESMVELPTVNYSDLDKKLSEFNAKYSKGTTSLEKAGALLVGKLKTQKEELEKARKKSEQLIKDKKVVSENEKDYKEALALIEKVEDKQLKKELSDSLAPVKKAIDKTKAEKAEKARKEKERIAREKAEAEKALAEQKRLEQEQQVAYQAPQSNTNTSNNNSSNTSNQGTVTNNPVAETKPVEQTPEAVAPVRTDGFNFLGYNFPIQTFYGVGQVPLWTPYIFSWGDMPNHYLVERASDAGSAIRNVGVGTQITINGQTYTVYKKVSGLKNTDENQEASGVLFSEGAPISFQTCDTGEEFSPLTLWFAH